MATTYLFSGLANGQHLAFHADGDILRFDLGSITASAVQVTQLGDNIGFTHGSKTVWLDSTRIGELSLDNVRFANGSVLAVGDGTTNTLADWYGHHYDLAATTVGQQVWGLGGADLIETGSGNDWLVGNAAPTPFQHLSRVGTTASPNPSYDPSISADGRLVAFQGGWTEFGSLTDSYSDVLVKDVATGSFVNENKSAAGAFGSSNAAVPVISADGQWVVFQSSSYNLVSPSTPSYTIFVASTTSTAIEAVSTTAAGEYADNGGEDPDLSADGRYVVFSSRATNLATGGNSSYEDVYLKDRDTGEIQRLSTSTTGGDGNYDSSYAKISADGRFVVFESGASNLTAGDTNGYADVFIWDRGDGSLTNLTSLMPSTTQNPNNGTFRPDVAFDNGMGGVIVFQTAKRLVADDDYNNTDIYAYYLESGEFQLVSSTADGTDVQLSSEGASVSGDGRFVVFSSWSDSLVAGDSNGYRDVFVKDLHTGAIALVSRAADGTAADNASGNAEISLGGDWIVFESTATNLASTDTNGTQTDVYRVANPLLRDILVGGAGNDTYVLARHDIVQEQANGGTDTVRSAIHYTLGAHLENLVLTGSANLNGTGNALDNLIAGNAGNNLLNGGGGTDTVSYAAAGAAVTVTLAVTTAQATGAGTDRLLGFENLTGSAHADRLTGNGSSNRIDGGAGQDTMAGGAGNDTYVVDAGGDVISEASGAGIDTVVSSVSRTLGSNLEKLTLSGTAAINGTGNGLGNALTGNGAANVLKGLAGNDSLVGNAGSDELVGGAGNDTLNGGAGQDVFRFDAAFSASSNRDTINGFVVTDDTIELENGVFTALTVTGTLVGADFQSLASGGATSAVQAAVNVIYDRGTGNLYYDANGGDAAGRTLFATLTGSPDGVTAGDFVVT